MTTAGTPTVCFLTTLVWRANVIERGHMLWRDANDAIRYAHVMGYGIELEPCASPLCPNYREADHA
jgi:hypothetical protein